MPELQHILTDFHFLRPLWLLGLLLLPLLYLLLQRLRRSSSSWSQLIDPQLLGHLLEDKPSSAQSTSTAWAMILLILAVLALAGPAWKKIPQPIHQAQDALVVVLDLSLSMQVEDLKPSRLVKARRKLLDILDSREDGLAALLVYSGDAHVVSPLTDDTETIKAMVPALSPLIMPAMGSNPVAAIDLALQLLRDGGISEGRILLMSDGIEFDQIDAIETRINASPHELAVLAVGTADGGPIPLPQQGFLKQRGEIVIARAGIPQLQSLAKLSGGRFASLQLTDADIDYLLDDARPEFTRATRKVEREFDQWREEGPWLLLLLAPLAALGFRRGWIFSVALLVTLQPEPAYALGWQDLWQTPDQQGAAAAARGEHEQAASLYESPMHKGSAQYQAGDYGAAEKQFEGFDSTTAHYNRGNALARGGKLEEAMAAYDQALALEPDHEDAQFNKALLEQLQQQQQSESGDNSEQQDQQQESDSQQQSGEEGADQQEQSAGSESQDPSSPGQDQQQKNQDEQESAQQDSGDQDSEEEKESAGDTAQQQQQQNAKNAQADADAEQQAQENGPPQAVAAEDLDAEQLQALEQWLRRIPDDPSGLLRRKFDYQYRQRKLDNQFQPQKEGDPIW